jgi:hypothetical protein
VVVEAKFNGTTKTTLRSEGRSALKKEEKVKKERKKGLTRSALLEMFGFSGGKTQR